MFVITLFLRLILEIALISRIDYFAIDVAAVPLPLPLPSSAAILNNQLCKATTNLIQHQEFLLKNCTQVGGDDIPRGIGSPT